MYNPSATRVNRFNDYQNFNETNSRTKKFQYANNTPQKNKYDYGMFSRRFVPGTNRTNNAIYGTNLNKSSSQNISQLSIGGGLLSSEQLFSEEMIFLLSDEENNIRYFKEKIELEKQKLLKDFDNVKQKLTNILEDLKISFLAELDKSYLNFIAKYREFKLRMQDLRDVRKTLLNENIVVETPANQYLYHLNTSKNVSISNRDLLNEIERDAMLFKNQKLFNQISELQKERIEPARRVTQELIVLGGIDKQYYKQSQTRDLIEKIVTIFQRQVQEVYGNILDTYVISTNKMIQIHFQTKEENTMILNGLNQDIRSMQDVNVSRNNYKSLDPKDLKSNTNHVNQIKNDNQTANYYQRNQHKKENGINNSPKRQDRPQSNSIENLKDGFRSNQKHNKNQERKISEYQRRQRPTSDWKSDFNVTSPRNIRTEKGQEDQRSVSNKGNVNFAPKKVGSEQQTYISEWIEDVKLKQVDTIDAYQSQDAMLCCIFANKGRNIVTGGKDRTVRVYDSSSGKLLCTLNGHKASICSIANHDNFVSTGGDNGCSSLIVWSTETWRIQSKIQVHTSALTSIIDLQDKEHLVTGGYDKKIVIYNYRSSLIVDEIKGNNAPVACMSLTSDLCRVVSTGLDSSITVWRIVRKGNKSIRLQIQNTFTNSSLVCSLRCLALKPNLCALGTKDGKLLIFNLNTGQNVKKLTVSGSSIIQLVLFERQNKSEWPLVLSCSAKQKSMVLTKTDTGLNNFIDVKGKLNVDFGCGIGPKVIISQTGQLAVLSQSVHAKQINLYKITTL